MAKVETDKISIRDFSFFEGTVEKVWGDNTADISSVECGSLNAVPIQYLCQENMQPEAGSVEELTGNGYRAFEEADKVIVSWDGVGETPDNTNSQIVGFSDGFPRCCYSPLIALYYKKYVIFFIAASGKDYLPNAAQLTHPAIAEVDTGLHGTYAIFTLTADAEMNAFIEYIFNGERHSVKQWYQMITKDATHEDGPETLIGTNATTRVGNAMHYVDAYTVENPPVTSAELGCTPGYWTDTFCAVPFYKTVTGQDYNWITQLNSLDTRAMQMYSYLRIYKLEYESIDMTPESWNAEQEMVVIEGYIGTCHLKGTGAQDLTFCKCIGHGAYKGFSDPVVCSWAATTCDFVQDPQSWCKCFTAEVDKYMGVPMHAVFVAHDQAKASFGSKRYAALDRNFDSMNAGFIPFCGAPGELGTIDLPSWGSGIPQRSCPIEHSRLVANRLETPLYCSNTIGVLYGEKTNQDWNFGEESGVTFREFGEEIGGNEGSFRYGHSNCTIAQSNAEIKDFGGASGGYQYADVAHQSGQNENIIFTFSGFGLQTTEIHQQLISNQGDFVFTRERINRQVTGTKRTVSTGVSYDPGTDWLQTRCSCSSYGSCSLGSSGAYPVGEPPFDYFTNRSRPQADFEQTEEFFRLTGDRLCFVDRYWDNSLFIMEMCEVMDSGWIEDSIGGEVHVDSIDFHINFYSASLPPEMAPEDTDWAKDCVNYAQESGIQPFFKKLEPIAKAAPGYSTWKHFVNFWCNLRSSMP